jgi:glycosyltransferase involved in cell wall biosynthesis
VSHSIGIVLCYYEQPEYLHECICSLLNQARRPDEIVVVDDGSRLFPLGEKLLDAFSPLPVRLLTQANGGVANARNRGISELSTSLVVTLDADDSLASDYLAVLSGSLVESGVSIAYSDIQTFGLESTVFRHPPYCYEALKRGNYIVNAAMMRRAVWSDVRAANGEGYDTELDRLGGYEDHLFWLEAGALGHAGTHVDEPLFRYRRHRNSKLAAARRVFPKLRAYMIEKMKRLYGVELPELSEPGEP